MSKVERPGRLIDAAETIADAIVEYSGGFERNLVKEKRLHHGEGIVRDTTNPKGLDRWSRKHEAEVRDIRALPYWPSIFGSQRINQPSRPMNKILHFMLRETTHLKAQERIFAKIVGSTALANDMIERFETTPAFEGLDDLSLVDYAIFCRENGISFGLNSVHPDPDKLTDIADFAGGYKYAVARRMGLRYTDNFRLLVNKNMTRESYKHIPIATFGWLCMTLYWGLPPGGSAVENGISEESLRDVNVALSQQYREDREKGSIALNFVTTGTRAKWQGGQPHNPERIILGECYTESFMTRCVGGLIAANRIGDRFEVSPIIETTNDGSLKADFERMGPVKHLPEFNQKRLDTKNRFELADEVTRVNAEQVARLSGAVVEFPKLSGEEGEVCVVDLAA